MEQPTYYAVIPAHVRYDEDLTPMARIMYSEIVALTGNNGYCWPSNTYFAKLYNVTVQTVSVWISQLEKKGYLSTKIIYYEDSKQIKERHIIPNMAPAYNPQIEPDTPIKKNLNTPSNNSEYPIKKNLNTPIKKNLKDNNTRSNTTSINKENILKEIQVEFLKAFKKANKKDYQPVPDDLNSIAEILQDEYFTKLKTDKTKIEKFAGLFNLIFKRIKKHAKIDISPAWILSNWAEVIQLTRVANVNEKNDIDSFREFLTGEEYLEGVAILTKVDLQIVKKLAAEFVEERILDEYYKEHSNRDARTYFQNKVKKFKHGGTTNGQPKQTKGKVVQDQNINKRWR